MARFFCSSVNMFHLLRVQEIVRIPKRPIILALTTNGMTGERQASTVREIMLNSDYFLRT